MNKIVSKQSIIYLSVYIIIVILALIPFHAFLTVFGSSIVGHYTLLRLWKEYLLAILFMASLTILAIDKTVRSFFFKSKLIWLMIAYFVVLLVYGFVSYATHHVDTKALFYGWLSDSRYLIFFLSTLIFASKTNLLKNKALKLILFPAAVVILFGLLEILVLPRNFLTHFGYGIKTILPYQTINSNSHYVRIISTLRGSDPLGAYLLIPLSLSLILLIKGKKVWQNLVLLIAGLVVMIFSFSRSAWLGLVVAGILVVYLSLKSKALKRNLIYVGIGLVIIFGGVFIAERNNPKVQNIVFHYQNNSASKTSSDQNHLSALETGLKQVASEPLGKGPGTAGPASVYNNHPARISENYYIQIGQEVGWLGLIIFIVINILIGISLWYRRQDALSLALLVSFVGLFVVNMLLPAWTDDTLCYLWWGLAAIAIAIKPKTIKSKWLL